MPNRTLNSFSRTVNTPQPDIPTASSEVWLPPDVSLETSIDLAGLPCLERLRIDGATLHVESVSAAQCRKWPLGRIVDFRLDHSIGSCFLQANCGDHWIDVLRLPGSADARLSRVVEELKSLVCRADRSTGRRAAAAEATEEVALRAIADRQPRSKTVSQIMTLVRPFRGSVVLLLALSVGAAAIDVVPLPNGCCFSCWPSLAACC
jgi:hypothetical protein